MPRTLARLLARADAPPRALCSASLRLDDKARPSGLVADGLPGALSFWDGTQAGEGRAFSGRGEAARVEAEGPGRFSAVRDRGRALFSSIRFLEEPPGAPRPILLGGASFYSARSPGERGEGGERAAAGVWGGFAEASFVLPRWLVSAGDEGVFLRLTATPEEARSLEGEALAIERALADGALSPSPSPSSEVSERLDREAFCRLVGAAVSQIAEGRFEKVVVALAAHLASSSPFSPRLALERLGRPASSTRFALERAGRCFLGATPERLVSLSGGLALVDALAGSTPRARDEGEDEAGRRALLSSDKDLREHRAVVVAVREALAGLCSPVESPPQPQLRSLPTVHHLFTPVRARASEGTHVLDLVSALHPTPAVGGMPRHEALDFLAEREGFSRGWYASPVGWFDAAGEGAFAVAIRSALLRGAEADLFAGAGIVRGSLPERELSEVLAKRAVMLSALGGRP